MSTSGSDNQTPSPSSQRSERMMRDDEDFEPYVRRKNSESEAKRRMEGLNEEEQNLMRTSINSRERKRMHDLNDALDDLRSCLPKIYTEGPGARRLSKINTLILAANRIRQLHKINEKLVAENNQLRSNASCSPQSQSFKEDVPPSDLPSLITSVTPRPSSRITIDLDYQPKISWIEAVWRLAGKPLFLMATVAGFIVSTFAAIIYAKGLADSYIGEGMYPDVLAEQVYVGALFSVSCIMFLIIGAIVSQMLYVYLLSSWTHKAVEEYSRELTEATRLAEFQYDRSIEDAFLAQQLEAEDAQKQGDATRSTPQEYIDPEPPTSPTPNGQEQNRIDRIKCVSVHPDRSQSQKTRLKPSTKRSKSITEMRTQKSKTESEKRNRVDTPRKKNEKRANAGEPKTDKTNTVEQETPKGTKSKETGKGSTSKEE